MAPGAVPPFPSCQSALPQTWGSPQEPSLVSGPPCAEWPQAGDPAQDLAELLLRLFLSRQPWPRCPFLPVECGGSGKRQG